MILDVANKFINVRIIGEPRQDNLRSYPASALTQSIWIDYAKKNNITFKQKSLLRNPFNFYLERLFAFVVNKPVKFFDKGSFLMQENKDHKNLVYLCGELVSEPSKHYCVDGRLVAIIELATTEILTNTLTAEEIEDTEYHRILFFGEIAKDILSLKFRDRLELEVYAKLAQGRWSDINTKISTVAEVWAHRYTILNKKSNVVNFGRRKK